MARYTQWIAFNPESGAGNWSAVVGVELYKHAVLLPNEPPLCDFGTETVNVAGVIEYREVRVAMAAQLRAQFEIQV
jgi:hypothetical protein